MINIFCSKDKTFFFLILLGVIIYTFFFTALCCLRYQALFSYEWEDEAAENQMLWNTAHGDLLQQTIVQRKFFVDHVSPIHLIIAPFYRILPKIYTFYLIVTLGFSLGSFALYFLAKHILNDSFKGFLIAFIYLLYSPLHWINVTALEPEMLSIPFLLFSLYFFYIKKFKVCLVFTFLSLMCKENVALVVITMGFLFVFKNQNLKFSLLLIFLGMIWFFTAFYVVTPYFGRETSHVLCAWARQSIPETIKFLIFEPLDAFKYMTMPGKIEFFIRILMPLLFLPLISYEFYMAIPAFLQILLFESPIRLESYYLCTVIPFIFIGLIFSLKKIDIFVKKVFPMKHDFINKILFLILILCINAIFSFNIYGSIDQEYINDQRFITASNIYDKRFYTKDENDVIAWKLIKEIPQDASVSATGDLLVPLSHRKKLYEFAFDDLDDGGGYNYYDADFILINKKNMYHGAGRYSILKKKHLSDLKKLVQKNFLQVLYQDDNFLLYKKTN